MNTRRIPSKRFFIIITIVAIAFALLWLLVSRNLTLKDIQQVARAATDFSFRHPSLVFIALVVAQGIGMGFSLPTKALLTLLAGALLGISGGACATYVGVLTGTTALFFAVRHWLQGRVAKHLAGRAKQIEQRVSERPIRTMIGMRLFIFLPYGPCTVTAALSSMRYRDFLLGTIIGDTPVILLYTLAGERLLALTSTSEALSPSSVIVLAVFGTVFLAGALLGKRHKIADETCTLSDQEGGKS
ncbi:MAG: VTT domain-containing protein [Deltaproteobacteria bacterium]|nr:VTT domain-containing protein [Deltaproteobacteria bacterium]